MEKFDNIIKEKLDHITVPSKESNHMHNVIRHVQSLHRPTYSFFTSWKLIAIGIALFASGFMIGKKSVLDASLVTFKNNDAATTIKTNTHKDIYKDSSTSTTSHTSNSETKDTWPTSKNHNSSQTSKSEQIINTSKIIKSGQSSHQIQRERNIQIVPKTEYTPNKIEKYTSQDASIAYPHILPLSTASSLKDDVTISELHLSQSTQTGRDEQNVSFDNKPLSLNFRGINPLKIRQINDLPIVELSITPLKKVYPAYNAFYLRTAIDPEYSTHSIEGSLRLYKRLFIRSGLGIQEPLKSKFGSIKKYKEYFDAELEEHYDIAAISDEIKDIKLNGKQLYLPLKLGVDFPITPKFYIYALAGPRVIGNFDDNVSYKLNNAEARAKSKDNNVIIAVDSEIGIDYAWKKRTIISLFGGLSNNTNSKKKEHRHDIKPYVGLQLGYRW